MGDDESSPGKPAEDHGAPRSASSNHNFWDWLFGDKGDSEETTGGSGPTDEGQSEQSGGANE